MKSIILTLILAAGVTCCAQNLAEFKSPEGKLYALVDTTGTCQIKDKDLLVKHAAGPLAHYVIKSITDDMKIKSLSEAYLRREKEVAYLRQLLTENGIVY